MATVTVEPIDPGIDHSENPRRFAAQKMAEAASQIADSSDTAFRSMSAYSAGTRRQ